MFSKQLTWSSVLNQERQVKTTILANIQNKVLNQVKIFKSVLVLKNGKLTIRKLKSSYFVIEPTRMFAHHDLVLNISFWWILEKGHGRYLGSTDRLIPIHPYLPELHRLCNGWCARLECGRSWIRVSIESNQRL
jgi:hypothetical protein